MVYSSHITPAKRGEKKLQIPPLRYAPVGMTKFSLFQELIVRNEDRVIHALGACPKVRYPERA